MTTADREDSGVYAVIAEFKNDGPLIMETAGAACSRDGAMERMEAMLSRQNCIRAAVVRIEYAFGNELILSDMKRMQK